MEIYDKQFKNKDTSAVIEDYPRRRREELQKWLKQIDINSYSEANTVKFVQRFQRHRDEMLRDYLTPTPIGRYNDAIIERLLKEGVDSELLKELIGTVLTESFQSILYMLDGADYGLEESLEGDDMQFYRIFDQDGNLVAAQGELETTAWEIFHGEKSQ